MELALKVKVLGWEEVWVEAEGVMRAREEIAFVLRAAKRYSIKQAHHVRL
jgi:hypothetical protein